MFKDKAGQFDVCPPIAAGRRFGVDKRRHQAWRKYVPLTMALPENTEA